jgi:hypothetical protein
MRQCNDKQRQGKTDFSSSQIQNRMNLTEENVPFYTIKILRGFGRISGSRRVWVKAVVLVQIRGAPPRLPFHCLHTPHPHHVFEEFEV